MQNALLQLHRTNRSGSFSSPGYVGRRRFDGEFEFEDFASRRFHVQFTHAPISVRLDLSTSLFIYFITRFNN